MPRYTQLDAARLRRDLGLARARRLTVVAALGATGLTVGFALVAATTAPGRPGGENSQSNVGPDTPSGASPPGLTAPGSPPQSSGGGIPAAVSGGS